MRANKVHNEIKTGKITPRACDPCEMCRSEMRSSLGVVKLDILHVRLSRGLDARGCRLLRRRSVMPWWRRGSYATTRPHGRKVVSRREELNSQPAGLAHDLDPIKSSKHSTYLNPDGGGDGAGNTERNIDSDVK